MTIDKEPSFNPSRTKGRLGRTSVGLFVELSDGRIVRRPTTMLRPMTFREAMLHRPATSTDIIGIDTVMRETDELRELRERFDQSEEE